MWRYVQFRYAALAMSFLLVAIGYAGWVAWVASTEQIRLLEETQRLTAEAAQAATAAAIVRSQQEGAP